jgi:hypothetical protein
LIDFLIKLAEIDRIFQKSDQADSTKFHRYSVKYNEFENHDWPSADGACCFAIAWSTICDKAIPCFSEEKKFLRPFLHWSIHHVSWSIPDGHGGHACSVPRGRTPERSA